MGKHELKHSLTNKKLFMKQSASSRNHAGGGERSAHTRCSSFGLALSVSAYDTLGTSLRMRRVTKGEGLSTAASGSAWSHSLIFNHAHRWNDTLFVDIAKIPPRVLRS